MLINIAIADEHPLIRRGLCALIEGAGHSDSGSGIDPVYSITGEVGSTRALFALLADNTPEILLLGYTLNTAQPSGRSGEADGLALIKGLSQKYPALNMILVAPFKSPQLIRLAIEAGAKGYISHTVSDRSLHDALTCVMKGEVYIEPTLMKGFLQCEESLSAREIDVLRLLCKGGSLTDVSRQMHLSIKTVSAHKIRAMEKLRVKNDCQLYCLLARTRMFEIAF
ncbi:response regulator transcription factor [Enterobacter mori]|uniref:LuxR C-terminal-related transcriptional regulator n=1 Tax=Enterobacter mori TaxID=539813 RepID=UPI003891E0FC